MKVCVLIMLLLLCAPAWGGEPITYKIDIVTPKTGTQWQNEVYKPCMERCQGSNSECHEECTRTQFMVDLQGNPIISRPAPWEIRTIPLSEANKFLKANPEWEPFGVVHLEGSMYLERSQSGLTSFPVWTQEGMLYLRRRVR